MPRVRRLACFLPALLSIAAGCSKGPAWGSENAIIAVVDPALREQLEPSVRGALEREVFTTRPEPVFEVTFASTESIGDFRRWRRIVVIEPAEEGSMASDLLGGDERDAARSRGTVVEIRDEWALDQSIWVVSGPTGEATVVLARATLDSLYEVLYQRYVADEIRQMWVSGRDSAVARQLLESHGFGFVLPKVYREATGSAVPNTLTWFNEDPRRIVSVRWTERPAVITPDTVLAIRRAWGRSLFPGDTIPAGIATAPASAADTTTSRTGAAEPAGTGEPALVTEDPPPLFVSQPTLDGRPAIRLQGVWDNPQDRTSGLFVTYGVTCGDRLVLLDGNLFAPERSKIPYVVQFDQIFATFRCAAGA